MYIIIFHQSAIQSIADATRTITTDLHLLVCDLTTRAIEIDNNESDREFIIDVQFNVTT